MKTQSPGLIADVRELYRLSLQRKEIERKEKRLKASIRHLMKDSVLLAGDLCVEIFWKTRRSVDHNKVRSLLGMNGFEKISKELTYESVTIKPIKKAKVG